MAFDLSTAKPAGGFDLSTAKPVTNSALQEQFARDAEAKTGMDETADRISQVAGGALARLPQLGDTLLNSMSYLSGNPLAMQANDARHAAYKDAENEYKIKDFGNSTGYTKAGGLATDIAATAGAGPAVSGVVRTVAPGADALATAIETGGLSAKGAGLPTRIAGGAINGGAQAAIVNPESAPAGAVIGGTLPGAAKLGGMAGQALNDFRQATANKLMQSALKPTIAQLKSGDAQVAVKTLLDNGINPTKGGVNKLRDMIDDLNTQIADRIQNSGAVISKQKVLNSLAPLEDQFTNQVSPYADLGAIEDARQGFANHPLFQGDDIPVQDAQALKQGTYKILSKKYGQMGSADTEAQKGLARGLKDEIASAVPEVGALNAKESDMIRTLNVTERRALMDMNKNPMGLAALASNPLSWAAFMADKSALFKSIAARTLNSIQPRYLSNLYLNSPVAQKAIGNGLTLGGAEAIQGSQQ